MRLQIAGSRVQITVGSRFFFFSSTMSRAVFRRHLSQATLPPLQLTTLSNKIRVATESTPGHFSAIGLYIDAGSRYEDAASSGASHFLDRMAFKVRLLHSRQDPRFTLVHRVPGHVQRNAWQRQWTN